MKQIDEDREYREYRKAVRKRNLKIAAAAVVVVLAVSTFFIKIHFFPDLNSGRFYDAAAHDNIEKLQWYVDKGYPLNSKGGFIALSRAVENGSSKAALFLIQNGAELEDPGEESLLIAAASKGLEEVFFALREAGATMPDVTSLAFKTIRGRLEESSKAGLLDNFLKMSLSPHLEKEGATLIGVAQLNGCDACVDRLTAAGASRDACIDVKEELVATLKKTCAPGWVCDCWQKGQMAVYTNDTGPIDLNARANINCVGPGKTVRIGESCSAALRAEVAAASIDPATRAAFIDKEIDSAFSSLKAFQERWGVGLAKRTENVHSDRGDDLPVSRKPRANQKSAETAAAAVQVDTTPSPEASPAETSLAEVQSPKVKPSPDSLEAADKKQSSSPMKHPILLAGYIAGDVSGGVYRPIDWGKLDEGADLSFIRAPKRIRFYNESGPVGQRKVKSTALEMNCGGASLPTFKWTDSKGLSAKTLLGMRADWNAMPRLPVETKKKKWRKALKKLLTKQGKPEARPKISTVVELDILGDGQPDTIVFAEHIHWLGRCAPDGAASGCHSGEDGETYDGFSSYGIIGIAPDGAGPLKPISYYYDGKSVVTELSSWLFADVDRDGALELVYKTSYYEGWSAGILLLNKPQFKVALSLDCFV